VGSWEGQCRGRARGAVNGAARCGPARQAGCRSRAGAGARGRALARGELGHGLGSLGDGVLGELAGEDEAHRGLDLARGDSRLLVVARQVLRLGRDLVEDVLSVVEGVGGREVVRLSGQVAVCFGAISGRVLNERGGRTGRRARTRWFGRCQRAARPANSANPSPYPCPNQRSKTRRRRRRGGAGGGGFEGAGAAPGGGPQFRAGFALPAPAAVAGAQIRPRSRGLTLMNEFMMDIALEEIPVSGCTCLRTL
jgi:hypothetical protein